MSVGLIGPKRAGKSTLLGALLGQHPIQGASSDSARPSAPAITARISRRCLDRTLYEVITALRPKWERGQIQGHLAASGFRARKCCGRADSLSGGERARLAARDLMLSARQTCSSLDEPTNHLDVESIEALEDAVEEYDGTVILVSHDRALLRALTTRIWILHERRMTEFAAVSRSGKK